jgi:hypothetical protein
MAQVLEFNDMFYKTWEPKTKARFKMSIDGVEAYLIKAAGRPQINFEVVTLDHINVKRKLQGKGEWQDMTITLYDPIVPSGAQQVMEWVRLGHESITGRKGYSEFYKKTIKIEMLGPVGDVVETWTMYGAFPLQVNFGELDMTSNDPAQIELQIAYDYAVLEF